MCYAKLASQSNVLRRDAYIEEANKWAPEAMPQPGPRREEWVSSCSSAWMQNWMSYRRSKFELRPIADIGDRCDARSLVPPKYIETKERRFFVM